MMSGSDVAGELFLIAQRGHPGAAALGRAGKIIAEEQADLLAVAAAHFPYPHVRMPDRHVRARREAQSEQALRGIESGLDHAVEIEVRLDRGLVEIAAPLAQFFGVITPVPGRQRKVATVLLRQRLQGVAIGAGALACPRPDCFEQSAHRLWRFGHGVIEPILREVGKAQQAGALGAQPHHLGDQCLVVGRAAVVAAPGECAEDFFAEIAPVGELQEWFSAGT